MNDTILQVEDEENDVFFLKIAFKAAEVTNPLHVARDGQEAIDYLSGNGEYANREQFPLPGLMLLDLKLPRVMGWEVLKWTRARPELQGLVVVILTSSQLEYDIKLTYELGANSYLVKPSSTLELRKIAVGIKRYWLELNHVPAVGAGRETVAVGKGRHENSPTPFAH
jgi:two-component system response regulator